MKRITIPLLVFSLFFICGCASKPNLITNLPTATLTTKQLVGNDNIIPSPTLQKWSGSWTNSLGEKGNDTLGITTDSAGNIKGVWSGDISIAGQWSDSSNLKFSGRTTARDYQVTGKIEKDILVLNYTATRLDTSGTYTGEEKLTRK